MKDALIISLLSVLPRKGFSWTQGAFARKKFSRSLLSWYVRHYRVNLEEMQGTLEDYPSLAEFFVRPLKEGARPVDQGQDCLISPCDGKAVAFGPVVDGLMELWDSKTVPVSDLLGGDSEYDDGDFVVIYLAPPDYHRVHSPVEGSVTGFSYLPGHLWPVFPAAVRAVKNLFSKNERLSIWLESEGAGSVRMVMVGAYGVGRIETVFSSLLSNAGQLGAKEKLQEAYMLKKGDEVGRFHMGSTVILFFKKDRVKLNLEPNQVLRMGESIGSIRKSS